MMNENVLGPRIKETRTKRGLTQKQFAEQIGIGSASVISYEKGAKLPPLDTVAKIAEKFEVSIDWLCGIEKSKPRKLETYGDILAELADIVTALGFVGVEMGTSKDDMCSLESIALETVAEGVTIGGTVRKKSRYINCIGRCGVINLRNRAFVTIFEDWNKILDLYKQRIIDKTMYTAWIENRCRILNRFSLSEEDSYGWRDIIDAWQDGNDDEDGDPHHDQKSE